MTKARDFAMMLGRTEALQTAPHVGLLDAETIAIADSADITPVIGPAGATVYDSLGLLPVADLVSGTQAFVTSNKKLYISNGSGWYNVASINATPTLTTSPTGTIALAAGSATVVTMTAADSDGTTPELSLESGGDLFKFATVSRDSSVVTITPRSEDSATALGSDGSATLTFKASDGIGVASVVNTFTLSFSTDWSSATITEYHVVPSGIGSGDKFGMNHFGLSTDGTYAIFGASAEDTDHTNRGKAWIFYYNGSSWSEQTTLEPPSSDKKASLEFGLTCDISGDGSIAVVGALNYGTYAGAAYVYTRSGTTWTYRARLTASDAADYDMFGGEDYQHAISINKDGTHIVCGAHGDDDGNTGRGSAYVFVTADGGVNWTQQQKIAPSYTQGGSNQGFGNAVAFNNDATYMAIASKNMRKNGHSSNTYRYGVVFVYTRTGSTWSEQGYFTPSDGAEDDNFGWHISMNGAGDRIIAHSKYDDDTATSSGSIYVFTRSGSTWSQAAKIVKSSGVTAYDYWGGHCQLNEAGDHFVTVGNGQYVAAGAGKVYVYKDDGTDGTSWSLVKTLDSENDTGVDYSFGDVYGFTRISRDGKVIVNSSGNANRAYIFNT